MITIIGVRFRKSGKVYYFDPIDLPVKKGDHVIVETARGVEYGSVVLGPKQIEEDKIVAPLKPVIRLATPADDKTNESNVAREKEAYKICLEKIANHNLEMKLIDSEYTFDRNKLLFYFTADGRIDFRELVKDLASVFRTRIELRQIGVRDETKLIGGMAICGRPLCCHSYLSDFAPVSIKMAKEQNLSLNPAKISGVCGRLMCCLKNEQEAYEYLNSRLPNIGSRVTTSDGYSGEVQSLSVLKQLVKVLITEENGEKDVRDYPVEELSFDSKNRLKGAPAVPPLPEEEIDMAELNELVKMEEMGDDNLDGIDDNENAPVRSGRKQHDQQRGHRNGGRNGRNKNHEANQGKTHHQDGEAQKYTGAKQKNVSRRTEGNYYGDRKKNVRYNTNRERRSPKE